MPISGCYCEDFLKKKCFISPCGGLTNCLNRFTICPMRYSKTAYMALCGLFAALTAVCSYISIPLGFTPVPVNLATLAVFLAGGLLGKKYGTISLAVYTLLGAAGVPVFAGFRGGFSVLAGPTGGYIIGYILAAFLIGLILDHTLNRASSPATEYLYCIIAMIVGLAACYFLGTLWFIISTGTGIWAALVACVFPFLPGDALKIAAASILIRKLRTVL